MNTDLHPTIECRHYRMWLPVLLIRTAALFRLPASWAATLGNWSLRHSGVRYRVGSGRWGRWPLSKFATVEVCEGEGIKAAIPRAPPPPPADTDPGRDTKTGLRSKVPRR